MNTLHTALPYISTRNGRRFYPLAPRAEDVDIEDIAHGLAHQCRFNGQTASFYSVAQHSLMVAEIVPRRLRLAALLHDAAEAYLGDMVTPLKAMFPEFAAMEARILTVIGRRFGLSLDLAAPGNGQIKRADLIALATEKRDLMPNAAEGWPVLEKFAPLPRRIDALDPATAKGAFLLAFERFAAERESGLALAA
jgi:5'-deoxynucleotidase YfbR-like HD superfamily hydrolase